MTDTDNLLQRLRDRADGDPPGWGRILLDAADEIARLRDCMRYEQHRFATQNTHCDGVCYKFGPMHYECALAELAALRGRIAEARLGHLTWVGEDDGSWAIVLDDGGLFSYSEGQRIHFFKEE